jgi:hypothetical protein
VVCSRAGTVRGRPPSTSGGWSARGSRGTGGASSQLATWKKGTARGGLPVGGWPRKPGCIAALRAEFMIQERMHESPRDLRNFDMLPSWTDGR